MTNIKTVLLDGFSFNQQEFINLIKSPLNSLANACIILLPTFFTISTVVEILKYYAKDEQERQQATLQRQVKKNIMWLLVGVSIGLILKIFGLAI